MALIVWNTVYEVGVEELDADHVIMFSLINHLHEAKRSGSDGAVVRSIFKVFSTHARSHFEREEQFLASHGYPDLEQHRRMHRVVAEQLQELHDAYLVSHRPEISDEIIGLLSRYLLEHILEADMRYRDFLQKDRT